MKSFRQICLVIALILAFTIPALADGGSTQGPSITGETQGPTDPGDGHSPGAPEPGDGHNPGAAIMCDGQCLLTDAVDWSAVLLAARGLLF